MAQDPKNHTRARFERQFRYLVRRAPWVERLRSPRWTIVRWVLAVLLIIGGLLAILPFFAVWMLPVGLLILAIDIPFLQGPATSLIIRGRRRWDTLRRRYRRKQ